MAIDEVAGVTEQRSLTLKGDDNERPDRQQYVVAEAGRVLVAVPGAGTVVAWLKSPIAMVGSPSPSPPSRPGRSGPPAATGTPAAPVATGVPGRAIDPETPTGNHHAPSRTGPASFTRRDQALIGLASVAALAVGSLVLADAATAAFVDVPETGAPGHLVLAADDPAEFLDISPGDPAYWQVDARLENATRAT